MLTKDLNDKGYLLPTTMLFISLLTLVLLGLNQISRAQNIQSGLYQEAYKSRTMIEMSRNYLRDHPDETPPLKIHFNHGTVSVHDIGENYEYTVRTTTNNIIFKRSFPRPLEIDRKESDLLMDDLEDSKPQDREDIELQNSKEVFDDSSIDQDLKDPNQTDETSTDVH